MKKLLLIFLLLPAVIYAQQNKHAKMALTHPALANATTKVLHSKTDSYSVGAAIAKNGGHGSSKSAPVVGTIVGETYYDLQTNGSTYRRVMNYGTSQSVVWTFAPQGNDGTSNPPFIGRGTGYASNAGGTWSGIPTARIEGTQRTGFPNLMVTGTGNTETVICHTTITPAPGYNSYMSKNSAIGNTTFTGATITTQNTKGNIWPKAASSGNHIYMVDCSQDTLAKKNGVLQPILYSRSINGGTTWANDHITLPGYDSTLFYRNGGDNYFVDAKDSFVAIAIGGFGNSLVLWKSSDWGVTFTKTMVEQYPVLGYNTGTQAILDTNSTPDGIPDTLHTNTGTVTCLIDNSNNVHIWWTRIQNLNSGTGLSYFPTAENDLVHWSEATPTALPNVIDNAFWLLHDCDGNGQLNIGTNYFTTAANDGDAFYPGEGLITTPQAGIDASGNMFVFYSNVMDNDTTPQGGVSPLPLQNFRDILGSFSTDGGLTWSIPVNVSKSWGVEDAFPNLARLVDNNIYLSWMSDLEPGTALQNGDAVGLNNIMFLTLDKAAFMADTAFGCNPNIIPSDLSPAFASVQSGSDKCTINFTDNTVGEPYSWDWNFGDNSAHSNLQNPSHTYASGNSGGYSVTLIVGNSYGVKTLTNKAYPCFNVGINNIIDDADGISVYPNPTTDVIYVDMSKVNATNATVTVENALGQTVTRVENKSALSKMSIDLSNQSAGIYFVKIQTEKGVSTKRIVLENK